MIELKNVSKFYTNNGVVTLGLRNIDLKLNAGEIVAITGDSGSGKSTLLNVITAVDTYEEGEIYFEGNETSYFNQNDMDMFRKNNVSFIFQNYNIIDSYTVLENVMLPLLLAGKSHEVAKAEAKEIIEKVGLSKRIHHRGTKLSGGEKQRCVIARALASDSKILACDEPTGNLDSKTGDEIIKLIAEVAKDKLVLIVTHNYNQISEIATRRIKVSDGEIIEDVYLKEENQEEEHNDLALEDKKVNKVTYLRL
ncbi:MAG: ABC transporter ATP-binding protein, partial [Anaeroplasmataceae bacterium]|nr:ABC transporter ATP-binding protein [Anaeroplasmataceae bacterium]